MSSIVYIVLFTMHQEQEMVQRVRQGLWASGRCYWWAFALTLLCIPSCALLLLHPCCWGWQGWAVMKKRSWLRLSALSLTFSPTHFYSVLFSSVLLCFSEAPNEKLTFSGHSSPHLSIKDSKWIYSFFHLALNGTSKDNLEWSHRYPIHSHFKQVKLHVLQGLSWLFMGIY